jgi:DNA repair photolyase
MTTPATASEKASSAVRRGRGALKNPKNRFVDYELLSLPPMASHWYEDPESQPTQIATQYFHDQSKTILNENDSPDIGFTYSLNPYRGCEHGCIYCYARPTHEYFGLSAGLDFESKIFVKMQAAKLLREKLLSKNWQPETIAMSGVTDCYQPVEKHLQITRSCLEVMRDFRNPVGIVTKNFLVTRDLDFLKELKNFNGVLVCISITSLDADLCGKMEPRTSRPTRRLEAIRLLAEAGVPVGVMTAPMIPGLNDHEMPQILEAAAKAGARFAGYVPIRLPYAVKELFSDWLGVHFPDRQQKVLNHIKEMRGGKLNDANFGTRMQGEGQYADNLREMFQVYCKKFSLNAEPLKLSKEHFHRPGSQLNLW